MTTDFLRAKSLSVLALQFARVERVTKHEDGLRPETDSDHTVMLGLIASDLAPSGLDRGLVAQFSLVHDLVEADPECGDTQTLTIDDAGRAAKTAREAAAMERLLHKYGRDSWLCTTLLAYERQDTPEARYVRLMDKVLPKLTHLLNGAVAAKALVDFEGFVASHRQQFQKLSSQHGQEVTCHNALQLLADAMLASEAVWDQNANHGPPANNSLEPSLPDSHSGPPSLK